MTLLLLLNGSPPPKHRVIVGAVTMSVTPSATMDFTRHAGLVGHVTTTLTPSATLDFTRHASIAGHATVTLTPAATLRFHAPPAIVGSVTLHLTPSAAMQAHVTPPPTPPPAPSSGGVAVQMRGRRSRRGTARTFVASTPYRAQPRAVMQFRRAVAPPARRTFVGSAWFGVRPMAAMRYVSTTRTTSGTKSPAMPSYRTAPRPRVGVVVAPRVSVTDSTIVAPQIIESVESVEVIAARTGQSRGISGAVAWSLAPRGAFAFTHAEREAPFEATPDWTPSSEMGDDEPDMAIIAALYYRMIR